MNDMDQFLQTPDNHYLFENIDIKRLATVHLQWLVYRNTCVACLPSTENNNIPIHIH